MPSEVDSSEDHDCFLSRSFFCSELFLLFFAFSSLSLSLTMLRSCGYGIIVIVLLLLLSIRTILGTIRERKDDIISLVTIPCYYYH